MIRLPTVTECPGSLQKERTQMYRVSDPVICKRIQKGKLELNLDLTISQPLLASGPERYLLPISGGSHFSLWCRLIAVSSESTALCSQPASARAKSPRYFPQNSLRAFPAALYLFNQHSASSGRWIARRTAVTVLSTSVGNAQPETLSVANGRKCRRHGCPREATLCRASWLNHHLEATIPVQAPV